MEFKDILKSYRLKSGMTKAEFSRKLGIDSYSTYNNYEVGSSEPKIDMLIKIADLLNVSLDDLVGRTPTNEDEKIKEFQIEVGGHTIDVSQYQLPNGGKENVAKFVYKDVFYTLNGIMDEEKFKDLLKNLYFF